MDFRGPLKAGTEHVKLSVPMHSILVEGRKSGLMETGGETKKHEKRWTGGKTALIRTEVGEGKDRSPGMVILIHFVAAGYASLWKKTS